MADAANVVFLHPEGAAVPTAAKAGAQPGAVPEPAAPIVELLSAEKVFDNGHRALAPFDLSVAAGDLLTLIGPSGCGKSTVLKLVANLIEPTDGRILWWRKGFSAVGSEGRRLAFVFQDPTLMPWASVETNVRLPLDLAGRARSASAPKVSQALAQVGLDQFARSYPRMLSGGMRMRASIARALVTDPDLLLMDEPFGALDEFTRNKLDDDLVALWWTRKLTVMFVTHSIYEAVFLSTRVIVMASHPGRIFREVRIDEPHPRDEAFRQSPRFSAYCRELSAALTEASLARPDAVSPAGGA